MCGGVFDISHFYKHSGNKDGYLNRCKTCIKSRVRKNRRDNKEQYLAYERSRKGRVRKWDVKAYRERNPEKYKAHLKVAAAVSSGKLIKHPCEVCGNVLVEAHHEDYSKPLEVIWLCKEHHRWIHS